MVGFAFDDNSECNVSLGQECCTADECVNTCMVPCIQASECPIEGMGCAHGYCLFPCADNDADCDEWPGYTCQHGGVLCEND